jgi:hypothetical protein
MKPIELLGEIDDQHQLHARVPDGFPAGSVRVILMASEEDDAGLAWAAGLASEWSAELADSRQDVYSLDDGQPVNGTW